MVEEEQLTTVGGIDGHDYFLLVKDERRGDDRRSDGRLNAEFFSVLESSVVIDNVRVSQRLQKKSIDTAEEGKVENVVIEADDDTEEVESENVEIEADDDTLEVESSTNFVPRVPAKAIKCAVRKRSCRLLWLHEFYIVYGNKRKKTNPYVYQSLQFLFGSELPAGVVPEMSDKQRREIWVLGVCYVPSDHVRRYSKRSKGYMFHNDESEDDADKYLYGKCPEIVRVENCLIWHPMSRVERSVPRVVHADDIKQRRVYVAFV